MNHLMLASIALVLLNSTEAPALEEHFDLLDFPQGATLVTYGGMSIPVGEPIELDAILKVFQEKHIRYSVAERPEYRFWVVGSATPARIVTTDAVEVVWLRDLKIICDLRVRGTGVATGAGLSVGTSATRAYGIFGRSGSRNAELAAFAAVPTDSLPGGYRSNLGFEFYIVAVFRHQMVSQYEIHLGEVSP